MLETVPHLQVGLGAALRGEAVGRDVMLPQCRAKHSSSHEDPRLQEVLLFSCSSFFSLALKETKSSESTSQFCIYLCSEPSHGSSTFTLTHGQKGRFQQLWPPLPRQLQLLASWYKTPWEIFHSSACPGCHTCIPRMAAGTC